jgi:hypothetical protein
VKQQKVQIYLTNRGFINNQRKNNYSAENINNSLETYPIYKQISKLPPFKIEKDLHKSVIGYISGWIQKTLKNLD